MSGNVPPRENIVRAVFPGVEFRDNGDGPVLAGYFARFNAWNEIDSLFEGRFLERVAPGAYKKTISESRDKMRLLLNHGKDPELGNKPLGKIDVLREDETGPYYEASLFDGVPQIVMEGLRAQQYGQSYRFRVIDEEINQDPGESDYNPRGLPERTIREAAVMEFGPVTFPADPGASAGVRMIGDEFFIAEITGDPERLRDWLYRTENGDGESRATAQANSDRCPSSLPHAVMNSDKLMACHGTLAAAKAHAASLGSGGYSDEHVDSDERDSAPEQSGREEQDAPSEDAAESTSEPERRESKPRRGNYLHGISRKGQPWRLT